MIQCTEEEDCPVTFYPAKTDEGNCVCLSCGKLCMCEEGRYRPTADCVTVCSKFHPDKYEIRHKTELSSSAHAPSSASPQLPPQLSIEKHTTTTWLPTYNNEHHGQYNNKKEFFALAVVLGISLIIIFVLICIVLYQYRSRASDIHVCERNSDQNDRLINKCDKKHCEDHDNTVSNVSSQSSVSDLSDDKVEPGKSQSGKHPAEHNENKCGQSPAVSHRLDFSENGDSKYQEAQPCQATPSNTGPARIHCATCTCAYQRPHSRSLIDQHGTHSTQSIHNVPVQPHSISVQPNPSITVGDDTCPLKLLPGQADSVMNIKAKHKKAKVTKDLHENGANTSSSIHNVPVQPHSISVQPNPSITIGDETCPLKLLPVSDKTHSAKLKAEEAKDQSISVNVHSNPHQLNEGIDHPDEDEEETKVKEIDD